MKNISSKIKSDSSPLIIAFFLLMCSGIAFLFLNIELNLNHLFGFIAVLITIYTYFSDKQVYRYFFALALILGLLKYLSFSPFQSHFSIGNPPWISFNPIFLFLLILHLFFSSKEMR